MRGIKKIIFLAPYLSIPVKKQWFLRRLINAGHNIAQEKIVFLDPYLSIPVKNNDFYDDWQIRGIT